MFEVPLRTKYTFLHLSVSAFAKNLLILKHTLLYQALGNELVPRLSCESSAPAVPCKFLIKLRQLLYLLLEKENRNRSVCLFTTDFKSKKIFLSVEL